MPEPANAPVMPPEIQKELDELRAFRKKVEPVVEQARKQDGALKKIRENNPELFDYIVRTARGESVEAPVRPAATSAPETTAPVQDDGDPYDARFRHLEEQILNMGRTLAKAVEAKLTPLVSGQARTQWDLSIERLRRRLEKKDGPGALSDEIVERMQKFAEELPSLADHPQGIEHFYALATREDAEKRGYDKARREAEERGLAMDAIWTPESRGPGAGTPDLNGLNTMEELVEAAARDPQMWDRAAQSLESKTA